MFASPANEPSSFPSHSKSPKPTAKKPGQGKVSPFPNESRYIYNLYFINRMKIQKIHLKIYMNVFYYYIKFRNSTWPYISQNLEIRSSIEAKIQQGFKKE